MFIKIVGSVLVVVAALVIAWITPISSTDSAIAQEQKFTAMLAAEEEVPPTDSQETSLAEFTVTGDNAIQYSVTGLYSNLQNVTAAHIHSGKQGENGPIVVTLFKYDSPKSQVTENGTITADKLEGPMVGKQLTDLVTAMNNGETYVNIHTVQNPNGEVRGQIMRSG